MTTQQVLDKQGLQHYATKMCNAENRKVGSKSLPTALNDIDTAIDGFKTLFNNEYGTPVTATIENNSNIFTVGTGNGIDKSNEVQNSFTDITIKGNSLVNCIIPNTFTSSNNMGEKENNPVYNNGTIKMTSFGSINQNRFSPKFERGIIKPNTDYTFVFNISQNSLSGQTFLTYVDYKDASAHNVSPFSVNNVIQGRETGIFKYCIRSKSDLSDCDRLFRTLIWNDSKEGETITFSVMILEGDYTNKPLPSYFEGLKSIGENEENNMENLITRGNAIILNRTATSITITTLNEWAGVQVIGYRLKPNITYRLKFDTTHEKTRGYIRIRDTNEQYSSQAYAGGSNNFTFTMPENSSHVLISIETSIPLENIAISNIQLKEGVDEPVYEPHKENKKEILLNEPLRGVDDVKDTIEKINGEWKIVRRCKEVVYNGTENLWFLSGNNRKYLERNVDDLKEYGKALSDTLPKVDFSAADMEHPIGFMVCGHPAIRFNVMSKNDMTLQEGLNWLSQNPTRVIYELKTPIIEDIDPVVLQCWKGGSIFIDEVLPVESTHTVALNKTAQIQNNIEELTSLRDRVQRLEEQYNSTILTQAYQTILLNFDNDL